MNPPPRITPGTLTKIKDRPDAQLLQTVMLRSLSQAVYSPDNVGHFGLAYERILYPFYIPYQALPRSTGSSGNQGGIER